ncbi:triose-phosphate isomerase [Clostridium sp. WILCCON 0185]|uniref:Triosephosphate isomerase n=2 Tax=Candidatus Clostridium stratigraminis TaxID=3381661 RepID=A0ABW8T8N0_9CLOT
MIENHYIQSLGTVPSDLKEDIYKLVKEAAYSETIKSKSFIIAANWKMNKNTKEVIEFLDFLNKAALDEKNTFVLFPPYPYLYLMRDKLRYSKVLYGVQNMFWENSGAFTGEVSPAMAKDFGCKYAIIGHSERRNIFKETDEMLEKKVEACIKNGLKPILCIGENLEERQSKRYEEKLKNQLVNGLAKLNPESLDNVIIAYEPVWAIGTGMNATPAQVEDTHGYIRYILNSLYGADTSEKIPILYGGSAKASNVIELAIAQNVSGFLIGGASLCIKEFKEIMTKLGK